MDQAWNHAKQMAEKHANAGGIFVRLSDSGDKIVGAFLGEPCAREVIWTGQRYETFDENNAAHQSKRPSLRVMLNFYVPADGAMKIIEGGSAWFKDVLKLRDKYGLDNWLFEIERQGAAGDPKTTYTILPETKVDDAMRAHLDAAPLHDLNALVERDGDQETQGTAGAGTDAQTARASAAAACLAPHVADALVSQLRALPRSEVDAFLKEFGVPRVREVAASQEAAARAFIETRLAAHNPASTDLDPFA